MQKVVSINFFDLFLNGVKKFLEQLSEFTHLMRRYLVASLFATSSKDADEEYTIKGKLIKS